ncbi:hypothetical protein R6Q59_030777 [Mikania micrantha]
MRLSCSNSTPPPSPSAAAEAAGESNSPKSSTQNPKNTNTTTTTPPPGAPPPAAATTATATTFSPNSTAEEDSDVRSLRAVQGFGRIGGNSLAVEKDSDDPYVDFRDSMLQMIMEKEIYRRDDLRELLNCFLQLNSPYYHGIIIRAFTEIWNNVLSCPEIEANQSSISSAFYLDLIV